MIPVTRHRLIATARLIENLADLRNQARDHVAAELVRLDGYANAGANNTKITYSAELTPTEAAAEQRFELTAWLDDIEASCNALAHIAAETVDNCHKLIGKRINGDTPRCDATGLEGYLLPWPGEGWSDLNCQDQPARGKLCFRCYQRCRRWRQEHELPPLRDDVTASDLR